VNTVLQQRESTNAARDRSGNDTSGLFVTPCDQDALQRLEKAYSSGQPMAVLTGNGEKSLRQTVDCFVRNRRGEDGTEVIRLEEPFVDALHCMRFVIQSIDFDPKDLNISDLEKVFSMFLSFQRTHKQRTVICLENAQDFDWWTLDKMRRHIRREAKCGHGLMIVLSGSPALLSMMSDQPLQSVVGYGPGPISLAVCSRAETHEYICQQVESKSNKYVGDVFEYESLTMIHKISGGVKDTTDDLCRVSTWLSDRAGKDRVSTETVRQAAAKLGLAVPGAVSEVPDSEIDSPPATGTADNADTNTYATTTADCDRRLVVCIDNRVIHGLDLSYGNVLVGIDEYCDIRISGPHIAKHHALVINSAEGAEIAHLGGDAQTVINGKHVKKQMLVHGDVIEIGKYRIEYVDRCAETDAFCVGDAFDQLSTAERKPRELPQRRATR